MTLKRIHGKIAGVPFEFNFEHALSPPLPGPDPPPAPGPVLKSWASLSYDHKQNKMPIGVNANANMWQYEKKHIDWLKPIANVIRWNGTSHTEHGFSGTTNLVRWENRIKPGDGVKQHRTRRPIAEVLFAHEGTPFLGRHALRLDVVPRGYWPGQLARIRGDLRLTYKHNGADKVLKIGERMHSLIEPWKADGVVYFSLDAFLPRETITDVEVHGNRLAELEMHIKPLVPMETKIEVCNKVGASIWQCVPHLADDDYVAEMCKLIKDTHNTGVAYIEYGNELPWNLDVNYCMCLGRKYRLHHFTAYGRRAGEVFAIAKEILGDKAACVIAGQAAWGDVARKALAGCETKPDALAIAPYMADSKSDTVDGILDDMGASLVNVLGTVKRHKKLADEHGLRLINYEGGAHQVAGDDVEQLLLNIKALEHPRMKKLYHEYLTTLAMGGVTLHPHYQAFGEWTKHGCWAAVRDGKGTTPSYDAMTEWISG